MTNKPEKSPASLKNLGPKTREWLSQIGISSDDEIRSLGSVEVYARLKQAFPREVTLNMLYGLEAAIMGIHWLEMPPEIKEQLRHEDEMRLQ